MAGLRCLPPCIAGWGEGAIEVAARAIVDIGERAGFAWVSDYTPSPFFAWVRSILVCDTGVGEVEHPWVTEHLNNSASWPHLLRLIRGGNKDNHSTPGPSLK